MQELIVKPGLYKQAAPEDGPSFEQQFGILSNAVVVDKFPQLDADKLAFQLIEKDDETQDACGAVVYLLGKNVIFVPSFYKKGKLKSGDMFYIAETQQFLPLSDPWLAYIKNKDIDVAGDIVDPADVKNTPTSLENTSLRTLDNPLTKNSSLIWNKEKFFERQKQLKTANTQFQALLKSADLKQYQPTDSIFDAALTLGKQASEAMIDNLIHDPRVMNATLHFYTGEDMDKFAHDAEVKFQEPPPAVELIMPFDKAAASLTTQELNALHRDGYFIRKQASKDGKTPDVLHKKNLHNMFTTLSEPGINKLVNTDGDVVERLVLRKDDSFSEECCGCICDDAGYGLDRLFPHAQPGGKDSASYMHQGNSGPWVVIEKDNEEAACDFRMNGRSYVICGAAEPFKPEMLESVGKELDVKKQKSIPYEALLLFPNGVCTRSGARLYADEENNCFLNGEAIWRINDNEKQTAPILSGDHKVLLPKGTRIIMPFDCKDDGTYKEEKALEEGRRGGRKATGGYITQDQLDAFLTVFADKHYHKVKVYSDGHEYTVSGDKSSDESPKQDKNAAFQLVSDYGIDPAVAKLMLKEAANGASFNTPRAMNFWIEKTAYSEDPNPEPSVGYSKIVNTDPVTQQLVMPEIGESPEALATAVQNAAQQGIKEVFDVTLLKLLCRQSNFFDEIVEDVPLFMRTLDSLCRKLFQFYWHTEKMEEKYGAVKLKALEDSLKTSIDSLSELTIFFKLRSVDADGALGDANGDLLTGTML